MTDQTLSNLLHEDRRFAPPADLAANANVKAEIYDRAAADPVAFWGTAAERLTWAKQPTTVLDESNAPFFKWFSDGELNVSYNCIDRHVEAGNGDRVAIHFVGEPMDDARSITYSQLKDEVSQAANALTELGVNAGDRVAIYLPMIPEAVVAMQACARIGAIHTVVFGGFSAEALSARIEDCGAKVVITADGGFRRGASSPLKPAVDDACIKAAEAGHEVEHVVVVRRTGADLGENGWTERDLWWHDVVGNASTEHTPQAFNAEHPLFVMYTSGTTGKPKGVLHTSGGYLTQAAWSHWSVFDLKPETDVFWCTADVGWITGHTYIAYGSLANGTTQVMYEGTPDAGEKGRWWRIIEELGVTIFYTAPTAIRAAMKQGEEIPGARDLTSLRILGSVGETINPEAYTWYRSVIGGDRTPVVDTWWQTETGSTMMTPLPGITAAKPGSAMKALPGISVEVVDEEGRPVANGEGGYLVITAPWPSMLRTIWGDDNRYVDTYWSRFPATADRPRPFYFAGDGAKKDEDGDLWVLGRVDDVMNVSGHRLSTSEIESALVSHPAVAESAVVGANDADTGQAVVAFVILRDGIDPAGIEKQLSDHVRAEIGPIAKPREILVVPELPKTRSGKIMRRLLRDVAEGREVGDTTTLADASVMTQIVASRGTTEG